MFMFNSDISGSFTTACICRFDGSFFRLIKKKLEANAVAANLFGWNENKSVLDCCKFHSKMPF